MRINNRNIYKYIIVLLLFSFCDKKKQKIDQTIEKEPVCRIQIYFFENTSLEEIKEKAFIINKIYCVNTYIAQAGRGYSIRIGDYYLKEDAKNDLLFVKEYFKDAWIIPHLNDSIIFKYDNNMNSINVDSIKYELIENPEQKKDPYIESEQRLILKHDTDNIRGVSFSYDADPLHFEHLLTNLEENCESELRTYWGLPFTLGPIKNDAALPQYVSFTNSIDENNEEEFMIICDIKGVNAIVRHIYGVGRMKYDYYQAEIAFSVTGKQAYSKISNKFKNKIPIKLFIKYKINTNNNVNIIIVDAGLIEPSGKIIYKWST